MSVELFYTEAASGPCGVIVNERGNHTLRCAISFRDPDGGSIESHCCIVTAGDVEERSSFSFVSGGRAVGTFRRTDLPISADETVIPGYGFSPYLAEC